ncbi:MAG TPA: hypothetical protein VG324_19810 [Blastocatellia bacterium]|nr:hypothetical protein [Blastocatellia bacterium]
METEENNIKDLDAEDLASIARRYYAARFPNPERLGCPSPGEIIKVVRSGQAPDQVLREHLFECSECFGEYRQELAQCRPAPDEVAWRKRLILILTSKRSAMALAPVTLILSSIFIVRLMWPKPAPEAGQIARSNQSDAQVGVAGGGAPNQTNPIAISAIPNLTANSRAMVGSWKSSRISKPRAETIDVDLDNYQVFRRSQREGPAAVNEDSSTRGEGKPSGEPEGAPPGEKVISLPATRASLVLRLPETGVPGKYNVSLINAFGQPLLSNSAFSPDGSRLHVTLDLRRVSPKKYRLRLSRNGEAPAFYDVIIGAR